MRLSDFRGRPVVLVFYPLDWSPGCSQQLDLYEHEHLHHIPDIYELLEAVDAARGAARELAAA